MRALLSAALLLYLAVAGGSVALGASVSGGPLRLSQSFDFVAGPTPLSGACGFEVFAHLSGTSDVRLYLDSSGSVVHEVDTLPSFRLTFFAPSTGKSVEVTVHSVVSTDYLPDGTALNTITGALEIITVPGQAPLQIKAGRLVTIDAVTGYNPVVIDGRLVNIPITGNTIALLSFSGVSVGTRASAVCAALSP